MTAIEEAIEAFIIEANLGPTDDVEVVGLMLGELREWCAANDVAWDAVLNVCEAR